MATVGSTSVTMADLLTHIGPDQRLMEVAETIARENQMMQDALWVEGNEVTGHRHMIRTGYPTATWRNLYGGVPNTKSTKKVVTDSCGLLGARSEIDMEILRMSPNPAQTRADEDLAHSKGIGIQVEDTFFYGNTAVNPERFMGLAERYSDLAGGEASENVVASIGTEDLTSIYFVTWHPMTAFMFYGRNNEGGLKVDNLGMESVTDSGGTDKYQAAVTEFRMNVGFALADWRYCSRICKIDSDPYPTNLTELMIEAKNKIPSLLMGGMGNRSMGQTVIYCNRETRTALDIDVMTQANVNLTLGTYGGQPTTFFQGIPIRVSDAITNDEETTAPVA